MFEKTIIVAVLALNCVFQVSSDPRTAVTAFTEYEEMYTDCLENDKSVPGKLKENKHKIKSLQEGLVIKNIAEFIEEIIEERVCKTNNFEKYGNSKEKIAVLLYIEVLASYYLFYAMQLNIIVMQAKQNNPQFNWAFELLTNITQFLVIYREGPEIRNAFTRKLKKLYPKTNRSVEALSQAFKTLLEDSRKINIDGMPAIKKFFDIELPNSVLPTEPPLKVNFDSLKQLEERITESELFLPKQKHPSEDNLKSLKQLREKITKLELFPSKRNKKESRICKLIQILMEWNGFSVLNSGTQDVGTSSKSNVAD